MLCPFCDLSLLDDFGQSSERLIFTVFSEEINFFPTKFILFFISPTKFMLWSIGQMGIESSLMVYAVVINE